MYINIDFQSIHYIEREIGNHSDTCVLDERRVSMEDTVTVRGGVEQYASVL